MTKVFRISLPFKSHWNEKAVLDENSLIFFLTTHWKKGAPLIGRSRKRQE
nr:MAG TPA: hypothetical protein [Caudoviricetes sp.]